jgi:hypothetical protein
MSRQLGTHDKYTIQIAAHGVVALMAASAPGMLTAPRAGIASAKALSTATGVTGQVLAEKPPRLPFEGSVAAIADIVLPAIAEAIEILNGAADGEADNFRRTMLMIAETAANANGRPTPAGLEMLRKIEETLRRTSG